MALLDVEDVLSERRRPKVEDLGDGYLFALLHFAVYNKASARIASTQLSLFRGHNYLVTLPTTELPPITRLFRRCLDDRSLRDALFKMGSGRLLYEVLDDVYDYCFPFVDKIGHKLDVIEGDVLDGRSAAVVHDIWNIKQEIISFRKIMNPERPALRLLARRVEPYLPEELELYFDDIINAAEQMWDLLENYKEVVEALEDTTESLLAHRVNDVLRVLTLFTAVLLPLTLVASLAALEFRHNLFSPVGGVYFLIAVMGVIVVSMVTFFKNKGWL